MPGAMSGGSNTDELVAKWHQLAVDAGSGAAVDLSTAVVLVDEVIRRFIPSVQRPATFTAGTFQQFVASVRALEKTWNQNLVRTLNAAYEAQDNGDLDRARSVLDRFIADCPWRVFTEIAAVERAKM